MPGVRIWAVESDYDAKAVKYLAEKLAAHLELNISIQTAGKRAFSRVATPRRGSDGLEKAVELYLKQDDCVIFVMDYDSRLAVKQRRRQEKSIINRIEKVVADNLDGRVRLAWAVHELEAWLLVDCLGICCYFARTRYRNNCRDRIVRNKKLQRLISNHQRGDTQSIVEATAGGRGAKEYLIEFSAAILKTLNPQAKSHHRYREALSPEIAEYVEIDAENLRRNASLQHFGQLLVNCGTVE